MNWTYGSYIAMNVGVGIGLFICTIILTLLLAKLLGITHYIIKTVMLIDLEDPDEKPKNENSSRNPAPIKRFPDPKIKNGDPSRYHGPVQRSPDAQKQNDTIDLLGHKYQRTIHRNRCLSYSFVCMCAIILGIMPVLIFEGCILGSQGVENNDSCPDDPMDCLFRLERWWRRRQRTRRR